MASDSTGELNLGMADDERQDYGVFIWDLKTVPDIAISIYKGRDYTDYGGAQALGMGG